MLIGLDGIPLTLPKTGVGYYTAQLARALATVAPQHEFRLLYPSSLSPDIVQSDNSAPSNLSMVCVPVGPITLKWWLIGLPRYLRNQQVNLFHGTNYDVPLWKRCPTVLTIYDLSLLLHPQTHEQRSVRRAKRRLPLMARIADSIIVPTLAIRSEVCEHLKVPERKVFVVPGAPRQSLEPVEFKATFETREKLGIGEDFVLAVGTVEPRKNLLILVAAFEQVVQSFAGRKIQLVIAGGRGWLSSPLYAAIQKSPARDQIVVTDYVSDEDLAALYSSCQLFVYPSIYEGFGLPPIEAMAFGAPVVVSNIPVLVESTGGAARVFDPHDANDLARAILQVLTDDDERRRLIEAGKQRAAELTWEEAARKTLAVYETLFG